MATPMADDYMDHTMDVVEDDSFQCKGCGEILEEGKAYELAGSRWHMNCFRCNECNTQLGDDTNLLLLGDGSLICNNCTYSCTVCDSKIEELAILTGDQAFCASCFRCCNCKRKIDNLRYARTSQGIFCMDCHESVMARRRKKSKAQQQRREKESSPMVTEKSLPALPPDVIPRGAFDPAPTPDGITELSPRPRPPKQQQQQSSGQPTRAEPSSRSSSRPARSPERERPHDRQDRHERPQERPHDRDAPTLQPSTYRKNRTSALFQPAQQQPDSSANGGSAGSSEAFYIPLALDPTPPPAPRTADAEPRKPKDDYFSQPNLRGTESQTGTPHIAFQAHQAPPQQQQGRQSSSEYDTPTLKQSRRLSKSSRNDPLRSHPPEDRAKAKEAEDARVEPLKKKPGKENISVRTSIGPPARRDAVETPDRPLRAHTFAPDDEADRRPDATPQTRKELGTPRSNTTANGMTLRHVPNQSPTMSTRDSLTGTPIRPTSAEDDSSSVTTNTTTTTPTHLARPSAMGPKLSDTYMQPRAPPAPPGQQQHPTSHHNQQPLGTPRKDSASSANDQGSPKQSPKLPRWSAGGDFSLEEDMARIMGSEEAAASVLRRISSAARHGRTYSAESSHNQSRSAAHTRSTSEMPLRRGASLRWSKPPPMTTDLANSSARTSPISILPADDPIVLKRQLKNSEKRVAELERKFAVEDNLLNLDKKVAEKRKTVSVLDTQAEIMVRQLESLAGVIERAKQSNTPIDIAALEEMAVKNLWQKLEKVKITFMASLEQALEEREAALEDKERAAADRDRALVEFEQLSIKNAQLVDMNNDLTHQIQERFKSQAAASAGDAKPPPPPVGALGIYSHSKNGSTANLDMASLAPSAGSSAMLPDGEDTVVESGPTVVQVRRVQGKKFNWKKGKTVAQNIAKGVNRTVVAFQQQDREKGPYGAFTSDNIGLPYNMTAAQPDAPPVYQQQGSAGGGGIGGGIGGGAENRNGGGATGVVIGAAHPPLQAPPQPQQLQQLQLQQAPPSTGPQHQHHQLQQSLQRGHVDPGNKGFAFFARNKPQMPKSVSTANVAAPSAVDAATTLFGSDLSDRADFERRQIPYVVSRCIEEVELRGMDLEGIYRKTGGNSQIKIIQDGFSQNPDYDISDPDIDITAVTSVLKQYFRKLPLPLLTFDVYERILESNAIADPVERCAHLRRTFATMPQSHGDCLEFLMFHLGRVAQREGENLMSPKNLAVVFAPTIMRDTSLEREITDMHAKNIAVQFIIENINAIFVVE